MVSVIMYRFLVMLKYMGPHTEPVVIVHLYAERRKKWTCNRGISQSLWNPRYHSLACPRVAGGKDGLPIWRTAADVSIINKSQAADRRWFAIWGLAKV